MKYIFATLITTSILFIGIKITEKSIDLIDKLLDYLEKKRNSKWNIQN